MNHMSEVRVGCEITGNVSCFVLAGTGVLAILAVAYGRVEPFAAAASSLVSLAIGLRILELNSFKREVFILTLMVGISWILALVPGERYGMVSLPLAFMASAYASILVGYNAGLAFFSTSLVPFLSFFSWSRQAILIASVGYIVLAGLIASGTSEKTHPLIISVLSPLSLVLGVEGSLAASVIAFMLAISVSRATEKMGCPFSIDSGILFAGSILGLIGLLLLRLLESSDLAIGVWSLGFILQLAGVLIPRQSRVSVSV